MDTVPGSMQLTDKQLVEEFQIFLPTIERISKGLHDGSEDYCERYRDFIAGGRRRRLLTQRMGHGGFTESQTELLFNELNAHFSANSQKSRTESSSTATVIEIAQECQRRCSSDEESGGTRLRFDGGGMHVLDFNSSVLLPELMILILMKYRQCDRPQAEDLLLNGDHESGWATQLLAFRQMFRR